MTQQEVVDGAIPVASELIPGNGIPPVRIKSSISKSSEFSQGIELVNELAEEAAGTKEGKREHGEI